MQNKKIITVVLVAAIVVAAIVGYEFFVANSFSGYTKVSVTPDPQPYSIEFGSTVQYNITFVLPLPSPSGGVVPQDLTFQVSTDNSTKNFGTIQGARYSFSGLQIVVGSVTFEKLVLYVKSTVSNSKPIISFPAT